MVRSGISSEIHTKLVSLLGALLISARHITDILESHVAYALFVAYNFIFM